MSDTADRVHISLDRELREQLRQRARAEDRTMRAVLERALRENLRRADPPEQERP